MDRFIISPGAASFFAPQKSTTLWNPDTLAGNIELSFVSPESG